MRTVSPSKSRKGTTSGGATPPTPAWIEPQLTKLVETVPEGDGWAHEIKFDGFRMMARIVAGKVSF